MLPLLIAACAKKAPVPTPRPEAYPRVNLYPPTFHSVEITAEPDLTREILVNDSARVVNKQPGWYDIVYPAYGLTVNCTLTPYTAEALANRMERIDRNLGDAKAEAISVTEGIVLVAPGALRTPVQFIATDSVNMILSGVAVSNFTPATSVDSVAPIIYAIADEMVTLITRRAYGSGRDSR